MHNKNEGSYVEAAEDIEDNESPPSSTVQFTPFLGPGGRQLGNSGSGANIL